MINYVKGDLFAAEAQTLAHGCNSIGKMGRGIAIEFRTRYPEMYEQYRTMCRKRSLKPGDVYFYQSPDSRPRVLNLITQQGLDGARLEYIDNCFQNILENYEEWGVTHISMPRIGAGLGRLHWEEIKTILHRHFENATVHISVYEI